MARHPNPNRPNYSKMIGAARRAKGWTQDDLAKATGLESTAIKKYEAGQRQPNHATLHKICSVLNINVYDVIDVRDVSPQSKTGLSRWHDYVEKPFEDFCKIVTSDNIRIYKVRSHMHTETDASITFVNPEGKTQTGTTSQMNIVEKASAIREHLESEYRVKLKEELTKLAINIATGKTKSK